MHSALKVIAIGLALAAGFYGPGVISSFTQSADTPHTSKPIDLSEYCMLSSTACEQQSVQMTLDRDVAQPLMPVKISVKWPNAAQDSLSLNLKGMEMEMGTARFKLNAIGNDVFEGEVILPVCTLDKMTWVGEISDGTTTVKPALRMAR